MILDEFFVVKLELFARIVSDYAAIFTKSLSGRKDSGFFTFGQICRYVRCLAGRNVGTESLPDDKDWHGILVKDLGSCTPLKNSEFLVKLKLVRKLNAAAKQRADKDLSGRKPTEASLTDAVNKTRVEFVKEAKAYISYLCTSVQNHVSSTTDLVRGMGCFDPDAVLHALVSGCS